ncbi:MAG: hypothetical protein J5I50_06325 [Chitinophagaceae bacterium]|nr:hypothetical protein [Chitinophagaceae bacterium]
MKKLLFALTLIIAGFTVNAQSNHHNMNDMKVIPASQTTSLYESLKYQDFNKAMRKLWSDHMHWTLATVDAFFNEPQQLEAKLNRLLKNQKDIGAAIVPFYGQEAGDALADLLTDHIKGAVPVLQAAKTGDNASLTNAVEDWYKNANDIANFLTAANPNNWPASATEPALKMHITHTVGYATNILKGEYDESLQTFEEALEHMLVLADILSEGIANQFPDRF